MTCHNTDHSSTVTVSCIMTRVMESDFPSAWLHLNSKTHTSGMKIHWYFVIAGKIISLGEPCLRYKRNYP